MLAVFFRGLWFVIFSMLAVDSYTILKKNEFDFVRLVSGSIYGSINDCDFVHINFFCKLVLGSALGLLVCALVCVYPRRILVYHWIFVRLFILYHFC
ncbi:hypothetical protein MtrunA17_Chr1g0196791 [Medicago truncatula]|uniref:Transmembrane protein n=1 Tax=Medicago truncatula TaxID=3880 RepID=A0A396JSE8_MEDTR|nr:hypothetical protein MtrunA17_Chr1g0196791 [Medicago truncatula]